jgi:hypothetical protein
MVQRSNVAELRAKTDRDLVTLVKRELDGALAIAMSGTASSVSLSRAEAGYARAMALLPVIDGTRERAALATRLNEVRAALDSAAAPPRPQALAACCHQASGITVDWRRSSAPPSREN